MKNLMMRRAAAAGGGVLALVAITSGAMAIGGGSSENPTPSGVAAASDERAAAGPKLCADDQVPRLSVEQHPDEKTPGEATVLEAVQKLVPAVKSADDLVQSPLGPASKGAPVWVEVAGGTYLAEQALAGGWHASPATLDGCDDLSSFKQLD